MSDFLGVTPQFMHLFRSFRIAAAAAALAIAASSHPLLEAREFEVVVYNVENLFDVDGISLFDDYQAPVYTPAHLASKLEGISAVLKRFGEGRGPDVVMFIEFEADQTPTSSASDMSAFLARWSSRKAVEWLRAPEGGALAAELAGAPVHAWLAKHLADEGLASYEIAVGHWRPDPTGHVVAQTNVLFSRFPIRESRTHDTEGARGILETTLDVDGHPLHVFLNHWKSGASDPETELVRIDNATVLKRRLDAILRRDPQADIVIGGDFNSQYNQKERYPQMPRTAMNDVLGSQGDELAIRERRGPALYNLWFELPNEQRGSDIYREEWGTLMQILLTRGLYDQRGVQYVDNSISVGAFRGLNADNGAGRPVRWQSANGGSGFSDHFPVAARFRTIERGDDRGRRATVWMPLENPSRTRTGPSAAVPVRLAIDDAVELAAWPASQVFPDTALLGRFFKAAGTVTSLQPFRVKVDGPGIEFVVWVHDRTAREAFYGRHRVGDRTEFVGELGQYRGEWQLVVPVNLAQE